MALIGNNDLNISYECSDLINELKEDIAMDGSSKLVNVWYKEVHGAIVYTNYDFIVPEEPIDESELEDGEKIKQMTMGALLTVLEQQNSAF